MGLILYQGPSRLDGKPIVAIASCYNTPSENRKTGDFVQAYILSALEHPVPASKSGADKSVCGNCPLHSACYVELGKAPAAAYRSWKSGNSPPWDGSPFKKPVRLGAYGDPAAIPSYVLRSIVRASRTHGHTGYTHQWHRFPALRRWLMASVEDDATERKAKMWGWRTFRADDSDSPPPSSIECPATATGGEVQCADCMLCNGSAHGDGDPRASIWTPLHGSRVKRRKTRKDMVTV